MLRCAWCMKKISENKPVFGLSVKLVEEADFTKDQGKIIQIRLHSRNTSVPLIVTADGSEAKLKGTDGIFAFCSEQCGRKMRDTLKEEKDHFEELKDIDL